MDTLFMILHVLGAVFIIGPMAILPMSAMRAVRAGNAAQVATLAKSTRIFSYLSLIVFLLGFALVGMADPTDNFSVSTPWILTSIVLYAAAITVSLTVVIPAMKRAAHTGASHPDAAHPETAAAIAGPSRSGYAALSAGSGVVALLLVIVVVLMVWKP